MPPSLRPNGPAVADLVLVCSESEERAESEEDTCTCYRRSAKRRRADRGDCSGHNLVKRVDKLGGSYENWPKNMNTKLLPTKTVSYKHASRLLGSSGLGTDRLSRFHALRDGPCRTLPAR